MPGNAPLAGRNYFPSGVKNCLQIDLADRKNGDPLSLKFTAMTADRLPEYRALLPIGTPVLYSPPGGLAATQGRVVSEPCLFRAGFDTCVVTLDNGMTVPCKDVVVLVDGN